MFAPVITHGVVIVVAVAQAVWDTDVGEITPAEKAPAASRTTRVDAVFVLTASVAMVTAPEPSYDVPDRCVPIVSAFVAVAFTVQLPPRAQDCPLTVVAAPDAALLLNVLQSAAANNPG